MVREGRITRDVDAGTLRSTSTAIVERMNWPERETLLAAWRSFRERGLRPRSAPPAVHLQPRCSKLLSVAIAFSLWLFVNFGERDTEESFKAALELRNIPAHLMITSPRVDFIDLRLSGPRTLLGRIDRSRLSIPLDLGGRASGPERYSEWTPSH